MTFRSPPYRVLCVWLTHAVACALVVTGCGGDPDAGKVVERPREQSSPATATSAEPTVLVDVSGHVRRPGVYQLAADARVHEAIRAAGGARPGAGLAQLNRAAVLVDGQQVLVPSGVEGGVWHAPSGTGSTSGPAVGGAGGSRVSLSTADATALDALPGIGPVTAERIIADRSANGPFGDVDDLDRVPGIGPATIEALREVVAP